MGNTSTSALHHRDLFESCAHTTRRRLGQALEGALAALPEEAANHTYFDDALTSTLTCQQAVAQASAWRTEILATFDRELSRLLAGYTDAQHQARASSPPLQLELHAGGLRAAGPDTTVLELLSVPDAAKQIASRRASPVDDELRFCVESRLAHLMGASALDGAASPLGSESMSRALRAACAAASGERPVQHALRTLLEPKLATATAVLFEELNAYLLDEGVLPDLRYVARKVHDSRPARARTGAVHADLLRLFEGVSAQSVPPQMPDTATLHGAILAAEQAAGRGNVPDIAALIRRVLETPGEMPGAGLRLVSGDMRALFVQIAAIPVAPALIQVLADRQAGVPSTPPGRGGPILRQDVISMFAAVRSADRHPVDRLTGELVSGLFDEILADETMPPYVRAALARLETLTLKAALIDRTLFARDDHPARQFIAAIGETSADPEYDVGEAGPYAAVLDDAVTGLLLQFTTDLQVIEQAHDRFRAEVRRRANRTEAILASLAETALAKELAAQAKADAIAQVEKRLHPQMPRFVARFALDVWARLLADADLRGLADEDSYAARLEVLDLLLWSVSEKAPAEATRLVGALPGLIASLRHGMRAVRLKAHHAEAFLSHLMQYHSGEIRSAREALARGRDAGTKEAHTPAPRTIHGDADSANRATSANSDGPPTPDRRHAAEPASARVYQFPRITRGETVAFHEAGQVVRRKLSWVSPQKSIYIFSSDTAGQVSMTMQELLDAIRARSIVRLGHDGTIIDRALSAIRGRSHDA